MPFKLPSLPYSYGALEPTISSEVMRVHHDQNHKKYVDELNDLLEQHPKLQNKSASSLLEHSSRIPESFRNRVINYAGGVANHTMFWKIMTPGGSKPSEIISGQLDKDFGSFGGFKQEMTDAAMTIFGSGWVWLVWEDDQLDIITLSNQDNPLMKGFYPIMGIDVWEHAYVPQYKADRKSYLEKWWNVANWPEIEKRYVRALQYSNKHQ